MQNHKYRSCLQVLFFSLVAAFVVTSCTKEDLGSCPTPYILTIKAFTAEGEEATAESIKDIALYVFDANNQFLGIHTDAALGQSLPLNYPAHEHLRIVAWANAAQGKQTLPTLAIGDKLETAFVSLTQTRATLGIIQSPNDLFYGAVDLNKEHQNVETTIPIYHKTAGVSITARNLKQYANAGNENFTYIVRKTGNKLDFKGKEAGEFAAYMPPAAFIENKDEFTTPIFNILATTSDIEVDIFYGEILVATILRSPDSKPLRVEAGKVLNILVEFAEGVSVNVSVTPWGEKQLWKDFN